MGVRDSMAAGIRKFADIVSRPAFAGTPYPDGKTPQSATSVELGGTGTFLFGGFLRGEDPNEEMDSLTGIQNLDKMRRSDAQVNAALSVIFQPIQAADVSIDSADASPEAIRQADFVRWNLLSGAVIQWDDFIRQALLMLPFGFYLFEKVWSIQEDGPWTGFAYLRKLAPRPPKTVWQWFTDEDGNLLSIKQLAVKAGTYQFLDIPAEKLVRFTYRQEGDNFAGISILRSAYPHWKIKQQLYIVDAIRAQRFGVGIPRAKLKAGYSPTEADRVSLTNTLMGMTSHQFSYIVQPEQVDIDILIPNGTQGGADVMKTINHHNEMITRNVLASFLDMGGRSMGGSNALGASAMDFFSNAENAISEYIQDVVNRQMIAALIDANFGGPAKAGYPQIRFTGIKQRNLQAIAAIVASLSKAGMGFGDLETQNTFRAMLDLPELPDPADGEGSGAPTGGKIPPKAHGAGLPPPGGTSGPPAGGGSHPAETAAPGGAPAAAESASGGGPAESAAPAGPAHAAAPAGHAVATKPHMAELTPAPAEDVQPKGAAVTVPANPHPQSARPAHPPTEAEAAVTSAATDHTETARTAGHVGPTPAETKAWEAGAAVPTKPRTVGGQTEAVSHGVPPTAHMARSTTIASSGAADEEGHSSTEADSPVSSPQPAVASQLTGPAVPATTVTRTPTSATSKVGLTDQDAESRSMASRVAPTNTLSPTLAPQTRRGKQAPDRATPEAPETFWRQPTPLESRVLDLREMPRRLEAARGALLNTLRSARAEQISRIAIAVAHRKPGDVPKAPLVGKVVADVLKVTREVASYGQASVEKELKAQRVMGPDARRLDEGKQS